MTYIFINKYDDAKIFIEKFRMKKLVDVNIFQVFKSDDKFLTIIKGGVVNTAAAVSRTFTLFQPNENIDNIALLININEENNVHEKNKIFIANKIHDSLTNKDFYPDIIYKHSFIEGEINSKLNKNENQNDESGAFYQTSSNFLSNHSIVILKIYNEESINEIIKWIELIKEIELVDKIDFTEDEKILLSKISTNLKLSEALKQKFLKFAKMYKIKNGDFTEILGEYSNVKIESKSERSMYYGRLLEKLSI